MMKRLMSSVVGVFLFLFVSAQDDSLKIFRLDTLRITDTLATNFSIPGIKTKEKIYKLKSAADIPVVAVGAGWSGYAFTKIYSKEHSSDEKVLSLNKDDIIWFDRWAVRPYNESLDKISYYPFYASMSLPFVFLTGKKTGKDFFKLTFLYLEAMSITGFLYTGSVYVTNRYRPYAYSSETTMPQRTRGGAKNSFYAGHVALVATSTFFMAKVHADYNPDSKANWFFYSLAATATGATAYLRYRAGQHFPSDIILGIAQGTLTGLLVPQLHKYRLIKDPNLSITPYSNGEAKGFSLTYKF